MAAHQCHSRHCKSCLSPVAFFCLPFHFFFCNKLWIYFLFLMRVPAICTSSIPTPCTGMTSSRPSLSRHQEPGIGHVPYRAWFATLEVCQNEPGTVECIPTLHLLDFFCNGMPATASASPSPSLEAAAAVIQPLNAVDREAMGMAHMETEKLQSISVSLWNPCTWMRVMC